MCCKAWASFHAEARGWLALQSVRSTTITVTATLLVAAIFDLAGESEGCVKRDDICEAAKAGSPAWCSTARDVCDSSWCALANGTAVPAGASWAAGSSSAAWTECRVQFLGYHFTQLALVTIPTLIVNLVLSVLTPLIGVLCDISPPAVRRRTVAACNLAMAGCQLLAGALLRAQWQLALLCTFAGGCMFLVGFAPMFAYLPELLRSMTGTVSLANFSMGLQMSINVSVIVVCVLVSRWSGSSVTATQFGCFLSGIVVLGTCVYSLKRLGATAQAKAAAAAAVAGASPPTATRALFVLGTRRLLASLRSLPRQYPLQTLYVVSYALEQAAQRSLVFLLSAFLIEAFGFTQFAISLLVFWILLLSVAGTVVMKRLSARMQPKDFKRALVFAVASKTLGVMLIPLLARGTSAADKALVFVFCIPVGLVFAVTFALQRGVYASITPGGQEAEFFGYLVFGSNVFSWAPPLIATVMTEAGGVDVRYTMLGSISTFQVLSVLVLTRFDLDGAKRSVQATLQHRAFVEAGTDTAAAAGGDSPSECGRGHARVHPQSNESSAPQMHALEPEPGPAPAPALKPTETLTQP